MSTIATVDLKEIVLPTQSVRARPMVSCAAIVLCDLSAILISASISVAIRQIFGRFDVLSLYLGLWPLLALFLITYTAFGLYPGVAIAPVTEIRVSVFANTFVFLVIGCLSFILQHSIEYSRVVFVLAWINTLVLTPAMRSWLRGRLSFLSWWGYPVVIFGTGKTAQTIVRGLLQYPEQGFRLVAMVDCGNNTDNITNVPVFSGAALASHCARIGVKHALIAVPDIGQENVEQLMESHAGLFPHLLLIPDMPGISSLGVETRECCRLLTLQVRKSLLLRAPQITKRIMDIFIATFGCLVALPLGLIIAALIKLESPGKVLFSQTRIGRGGKLFRFWKFRSMVVNADEVLLEHFEVHPEEWGDWQRFLKLRHDPRVTRVGRLLRKTSLDELPQFWNVLVGDMSLVGPRPILQREIQDYGNCISLYKKVMPGITGFWQVSGRSKSDFRERVDLDSYYVRNWSPWLDIYLLARTFIVVLKGEGAY